MFQERCKEMTNMKKLLNYLKECIFLTGKILDEWNGI